jgi:hypothetical protein
MAGFFLFIWRFRKERKWAIACGYMGLTDSHYHRLICFLLFSPRLFRPLAPRLVDLFRLSLSPCYVRTTPAEP